MVENNEQQENLNQDEPKSEEPKQKETTPPINQKRQSSEKSPYVRKFAPVKDDCCNGKCKKELADIAESVEKGTMTCAKCKTEFSQGYSPHPRNVFFCEKCGQENGCAKGEFRV